MNKINEERKLYCALEQAMACNNLDDVNRLKYECLFYGSNLLDVVISYITLAKYGVSFDFGFRVIKKGTKLYRIRRYEKQINYNSKEQWSYPPNKPENRANKSGEPALYLGTTETVCILETHIANDEDYVLGEYEVIDDIKLGGFLKNEKPNIKSHFLACTILNAFLIAPSRGEKNKDIFDYLDEHYNKMTMEEIKMKEADNIELPLKFGTANKKEFFYRLTNDLLDSIKAKYQEGINYSSCYIPLSTTEIICSDTNIALYEKGMKKIKFVKSEIKKCKQKFSGLDMIKLLVSTSEKRL